MQSGQVVAGKYRIVGVLGEGGVGITYEAESLATNERVALKRVEVRGASSWKVIELFQREARILSHLSHPSIPAYKELFVDEGRDGATFWLAQSLARGRSLHAWIESGARCDENEAKRIARELLGVLVYLHQLRPAVIHRDIKPANVIRGDDGRVFLVDFGAVREALQDGNTGGGSTVAGTFGYMAPEQYRGSAKPQSDLYGLGATLLYLLARKSPSELPQKKLRVEIPREGLSRGFAKWLARMLEPAPEDRFASAKEALDAIDGEKTSPKRVAILVGVLATVLAGGVGFKVWADKHLPQPAAHADRASVDPYPARLELWQYEELLHQRQIAGHAAIVFDVAVSPDGARIATASRDAAIKLWDASTFTLVRSHGHVGLASGVAFTADGKTLVSAGDHTLRFWDVATGNALRTVDVSAAQATRAHASKDAIAVGSFDGNARVFDLEGKLLKTLAHSPGKGRCFEARFSPDGTAVVTVGDDATAKLWDASTGALRYTFSGHTRATTTASFSADGTTLATTSDDHTVRVWHVVERRQMVALEHEDEVFSAAFSGDGKYLLTGGKDMQLRLFDVPTYMLKHRTRGTQMVTALTFLNDREVIAAHHDGTLAVYAMPGRSRKIPAPKVGFAIVGANDSKEAELVAEARKKIDNNEGRQLALGEAETLCMRALEVKKDYAPAFIQLSRIARRRPTPSTKEAHAWLDKAEKVDPKSYDVWVQRAWAFDADADVDGARKALERAAELDPKRVDGDALWARLANHEKAYEEAIKRATRVIEGTTDTFVQMLAWQEIVLAYRHVGEYDAADAAYGKYIAAQPNSAWARGNYAQFLVLRGQYGRALEVVKEAEARGKYGALAKTSAEAHVGAGIGALWDHKRVADARAHFETAIEQDGKNANAWYGVAACDRVEALTYKDKQKLARSKQALQTALSLDPKHAWAKLALEEHDKIAASLQ